MGRAIVIAALWVGMAGPVAADESDDLANGHKGQFGVSLQLGSGFRGIVTYDEEFCGELADDGGNRSTCLGRSPFVLGIVTSYGITPTFEAMFEIDLGIEEDFGPNLNGDGPSLVAISPGFKVYFAEIGAAQVFSTIQFSIDFADYDQAPGNDYAVRNINGFQFDFHRTFGAYVYFGETIGWSRWLSFTLEGGVGMQGRFP